MRKKLIFGISIALIVLLIRLYCGVYVHDEFGDKCFFIKHRPTWKWKFFSPIGQSDLKLQDLTPENQTEQKYFNEFVRDQGLSR
jgi:hypothetical protein